MVEVPPEASTAEEAADEEDVEKIEVHVHLHRGNGSDSTGARRKRRPSPPMLTGVLFDWSGHYDRILKRQPQAAPKRWSRSAKCPNCDAIIPSAARHCPRCAAPRAPRILSRVFALIGLACVVAVFAVGNNLLGSTVPEHKPPAPLGSWSDNEEYIVVEVPAAPPSPFATMPSAANGPASPGPPRGEVTP